MKIFAALVLVAAVGAVVAPNRQPCNAPPWGALVAFDVSGGRVRWTAPLGSMGDGWPGGSISFGGPIVTAGGLVFTAAALDPHLRAFNVETGEELWAAVLPASAQATPMTYEWNGKQFVVICAGGHGKMKSQNGGCGHRVRVVTGSGKRQDRVRQVDQVRLIV